MLLRAAVGLLLPLLLCVSATAEEYPHQEVYFATDYFARYNTSAYDSFDVGNNTYASFQSNYDFEAGLGFSARAYEHFKYFLNTSLEYINFNVPDGVTLDSNPQTFFAAETGLGYRVIRKRLWVYGTIGFHQFPSFYGLSPTEIVVNRLNVPTLGGRGELYIMNRRFFSLMFALDLDSCFATSSTGETFHGGFLVGTHLRFEYKPEPSTQYNLDAGFLYRSLHTDLSDSDQYIFGLTLTMHWEMSLLDPGKVVTGRYR